MAEPIVDAHHHIWRQVDLPWLQGPSVPRIFGAYDAIKRDYRRPAPRPVGNQALVDLGRDLFFDPRISASGKTSCASCHNPNFWIPQSGFGKESVCR